MSKLYVDQVDPKTATTLTLGTSGDTITIPAGVNANLGSTGSTITVPSGSTIVNSGTATGFGDDNLPAFYAYADSNQSISDNTWTKVAINAEDLDSGGCYDHTTNYRFTPAKAGRYVFQCMVNTFGGTTTVNYTQVAIYKNGSSHVQFYWDFATNPIYGSNVGGSCTITSDADDYFELYTRTDLSTGTPSIQGHGGRVTYFAATRIAGLDS